MSESLEEADLAAIAEVFTNYRIVDLSHRLQPGIPHFPTHSAFFHLPWSSINDPATMNVLLMHEHNGTHVDAPLHLILDSSKVDPEAHGIHNVSIDSLLGPCCCIKADLAAEETLSEADIKKWEDQFGPIAPGSVVLINFGWHKKWALGEAGLEYVAGWPGLDRSAAQYLLGKQVKAVGTDCLGLDTSTSPDIPAHDVLLINGVLIMENLANLDELPPRSYFMAFPLPIHKGSGSPVRALALVPR